MKTLIIDSERQKTYCKSLIDELEEDGSMTVEIKKTGMDSTAKQMRLRFMWMGEIAQSGLGQHDTKMDVDLACKYKFGLPILLRDDDCFAVVYHHFQEAIEGYGNYSALIKQFCKDYVSISKLMSRKQQSEYLTDILDYWTRKGLGLTRPEDQGVDLSKFQEE